LFDLLRRLWLPRRLLRRHWRILFRFARSIGFRRRLGLRSRNRIGTNSGSLLRWRRVLLDGGD
jgi:hypothetical protein